MSRIPNSNPFLQRLAAGVIIGDGAMGTLLYSRGIPLGHSFEALNLSQPELVAAVHSDYAAAGAQLLETNTFAANRLALAPLGQDKQVGEINAAGARLARQAAGSERLVAGAVGNLAACAMLLPRTGSNLRDITLSCGTRMLLEVRPPGMASISCVSHRTGGSGSRSSCIWGDESPGAEAART